MIRTIFPKLLAIVLLASTLGCSTKFAGDIKFKNSSPTELWVDVEGFDRKIPCGALGPQATAGAHMNPLKVPAKVVLTWNKVDQEKQRTELLVPEEAKKATTGTLIFEFDAQGKWSAIYKLQDD